MKGNIDDVHAPQFHKVFVNGHMFDFSLTLINTYLNSHVVESSRIKELDMHLDMNKVSTELTRFAHYVSLNPIHFQVLFCQQSTLFCIRLP